jgi:hypothetical protein
MRQKPEFEPQRDRFREYYMKMLTDEFADELDALRKVRSLTAQLTLGQNI